MELNSSLTEDTTIFDKEIQEVFSDLQQFVVASGTVKTAEELERMENEIVKMTDHLAGLLIGLQIQSALDSENVKEEAKKLILCFPKPMKNNGKQDVKIKPQRGGEIIISTTYYVRKGKAGKKKRNGCYAGLLLLGINDRCTPGLISEVSMMSAAMGSLEEARKMLEERGIKLNIKTLRSLTYRFSCRAREALTNNAVEFTDSVAGCRVVISVDGGRIRIRKNKRGPKTQKGRTRYSTEWREPKLLNIYVIDEKGNKSQDFKPIIDGVMKGPDAIFMLMKYYLSKLEIAQAKALLIVGDGAHWIWNRVNDLLEVLQIDKRKVYELLDFYHAVEHLGKVASLRKKWNATKKKQWIKKHRNLLKKGKVEAVIKAVQAICRGRNRKEVRRERDYFIRNKYRMDYDTAAKLNLPLGSGSMESSIRRVVNLRMKGAGIFWHKDSAEAMLLLRSFYKAGRWDMLKKLACSTPLDMVA